MRIRPSASRRGLVGKGGMNVEELEEELSMEALTELLKRPMRLVGVVKNQGHAGGGPFWVRMENGLEKGMVRPQIVEAVELNQVAQEKSVQGTHFNPVDMVCVLNLGLWSRMSTTADTSKAKKRWVANR